MDGQGSSSMSTSADAPQLVDGVSDGLGVGAGVGDGKRVSGGGVYSSKTYSLDGEGQ